MSVHDILTLVVGVPAIAVCIWIALRPRRWGRR